MGRVRVKGFVMGDRGMAGRMLRSELGRAEGLASVAIPGIVADLHLMEARGRGMGLSSSYVCTMLQGHRALLDVASEGNEAVGRRGLFTIALDVDRTGCGIFWMLIVLDVGCSECWMASRELAPT